MEALFLSMIYVSVGISIVIPLILDLVARS